jgi:uncharacterized protein
MPTTANAPQAQPSLLAAVPPGTCSAYRKRLWVAAGWLCMATGIVGIVVPLLPTTDFVLLAAYCFSRGSERWEAWLLGHPRFGPVVRDWRAHRVVPLRAKLMSTLMMTASCAWAWHVLPMRTAWIPAAVCSVVALYLWSKPGRVP